MTNTDVDSNFKLNISKVTKIDFKYQSKSPF